MLGFVNTRWKGSIFSWNSYQHCDRKSIRPVGFVRLKVLCVSSNDSSSSKAYLTRESSSDVGFFDGMLFSQRRFYWNFVLMQNSRILSIIIVWEIFSSRFSIHLIQNEDRIWFKHNLHKKKKNVNLNSFRKQIIASLHFSPFIYRVIEKYFPILYIMYTLV